ncbi:hypothetical protein WNB94_08650 [Aquabacterium sp. A3]|uniref:NACHT domain-containing protein n=1 Tax=Aquabacterium sp. A3 TaxID=3132829 RepID=UPI00311A889C
MNLAAEVRIARHATAREAQGRSAVQPLSHWRYERAYVLLAPPGAGKTVAMVTEAEAHNGSPCVRAHDMMSPSWSPPALAPGQVLYIDGLDEARAGNGDGPRNRPLYAVCGILKAMGHPPFRLSCREADWIEALDGGIVSQLVGDQQPVVELKLEPLTEIEIRQILGARLSDGEAVDQFCRQAEQQGLMPVMGNPLFLRLMMEAADTQGRLPETRSQTFERACQSLALEANDVHRLEKRDRTPGTSELLSHAGMMCAIQLLSGAEGWTEDPLNSPDELHLKSLPLDVSQGVLRTVLETKLFKSEGDSIQPVHRSVAEYLGAKEIARRLRESALPVARVLALMCAEDGGVAQPLRGLHAWLAAHSPEHRLALIERDPLGVVLYGDVSDFSVKEKLHVLEALEREAKQFAWFRNGDWADHPFGGLGTADMQQTYQGFFENPDRSEAHQSMLHCVLDAITHGQPLPDLLPALDQVVRDHSYTPYTHTKAADAWLAQARLLSLDMRTALTWLHDIRQDVIDDPQDELAGTLLEALYPAHILPSEVMQYFRPPKAEYFHGSYMGFWRRELIPRTPTVALPILADGLADLDPDIESFRSHFDMPRVMANIIAAALNSLAEPIDASRVHRWLMTAVDEHGFWSLKGDEGQAIREWLSAHAQVQKSVLTLALPASTPPHFWEASQLLHGVRLPRDWHRWLLTLATQTSSEAIAKWCVEQAAYQAINPSVDSDITLSDVEEWCEAQRARWPAADAWREAIWSWPIDDAQGEHWRNQEQWRTTQMLQQVKRRERIAPHVEAMATGSAPSGLYHQMAMSYLGRYTDIHGATPEDRLCDYLGDAALLPVALEGMKKVLNRTDLPEATAILQAGRELRMHPLDPACLLGAELIASEDPDATKGWPDELTERLAAMWLTDGTGDEPTWYSSIVRSRVELVSQVFTQYVQGMLRHRAEGSITGLWTLNSEKGSAELAKRCLPAILEAFPAKANQAQLSHLNQSLLPAAIRHVDKHALLDIIQARLKLRSLDAPQRISWLVAGLSIDPEPMAKALIKFTGSSQTRAVQMANALISMGARLPHRLELPPPFWASFIEQLAPHAEPDRPDRDFWVGESNRRRELVHSMIARLAESTETAAGEALRRLRVNSHTMRWRHVLDGALAAHTRAAREAGFRHASAASVVQTLYSREPANVADLAALTVDHLRQLGKELRGAEWNGVASFWRYLATNKAKSLEQRVPEIENTCRDRLMPLLRARLINMSVQLEKEASAQQDTRADLRVSAVINHRRVVVPIEIKKENHEQIWLAWRDQLEGRYATDPAAQGHGVYLVLWFGHSPEKSPEGVRPRNAEDLERLLSERIPEADRHRLKVVALDLSL